MSLSLFFLFNLNEKRFDWMNWYICFTITSEYKFHSNRYDLRFWFTILDPPFRVLKFGLQIWNQWTPNPQSTKFHSNRSDLHFWSAMLDPPFRVLKFGLQIWNQRAQNPRVPNFIQIGSIYIFLSVVWNPFWI